VEKRWLKIKEASSVYGIHPVTLYKLCQAKKIPCVKMKGLGLRVDALKFEQLLQKLSVVPLEKR
jgi:predicted site-specific integrase-resolvase